MLVRSVGGGMNIRSAVASDELFKDFPLVELFDEFPSVEMFDESG